MIVKLGFQGSKDHVPHVKVSMMQIVRDIKVKPGVEEIELQGLLVENSSNKVKYKMK